VTSGRTIQQLGLCKTAAIFTVQINALGITI
jgi:Na+-translocating ferredoxin:NAD+ oxidoreductase RnfE subunit